jgi:hypothetical protein
VPDWLEIVLAVAALLLFVAVLLAFVFCVCMWVTAVVLDRRKGTDLPQGPEHVALDLFAEDCLFESAEAQWKRDAEWDLTEEVRALMVAVLDDKWNRPAYIRPPVSPGRE